MVFGGLILKAATGAQILCSPTVHTVCQSPPADAAITKLVLCLRISTAVHVFFQYFIITTATTLNQLMRCLGLQIGHV